MATPAQCLASAPIDAGQRIFSQYERIVPDARERMNQFIEEMHRGFPKQCPQVEDIVREYDIAKWRGEIYYAMEAPFMNSALAGEIAENELKPPADQVENDSIFGLAISRDAQGPNVFSKILRFGSRVFKELERAKKAFLEVIQQIAIQRGNPVKAAKRKMQAAQATAPVPAETPRNASCPWGSGEKYKRCCGVSAPPVLCAA